MVARVVRVNRGEREKHEVVMVQGSTGGNDYGDGGAVWKGVDH